MIAIGKERIQFEHSTELHEIQTKEANIHLLLKHKDGFPTLNVITYGQKYSDSSKQQSEWLINSYRGVGLVDSKIVSFKERQLHATKGFVGEVLFTQGTEKRRSRVLILPYQDYQVVFTFMDQESNSGLSGELWEQILASLQAPSNSQINSSGGRNLDLFLLAIVLAILTAIVVVVWLRRRSESQAPNQKQD